MRIAGLFAGIGGIERGFQRALGEDNVTTELLCENWGPALAVLRKRFEPAAWHEDVRDLRRLPRRLDVLTLGFPCTDLSQAGRTAGISGEQSGLVTSALELIRDAKANAPAWLLIENVANMLALGGGEAMAYLVEELEALDYRWAYRVVDSRFTGVPQRRRRVIIVASRDGDPRDVLLTDDVGEATEQYRDDAFGFYWTEGVRGLGWAQDAVPTLKGGSTLGIPSPPAVWVTHGDPTRSLIVPSIEDAEAMQGFPRGWTRPAETTRGKGPRWKLVGNAVTVGVAEWVARRLASPGQWAGEGEVWEPRGAWPTAAYGQDGKVVRVSVSEFPTRTKHKHLLDVVNAQAAQPLSPRGLAGFHSRLSKGNLGRYPGFRQAVAAQLAETGASTG
ncbi:MAG TPA: DNA (cytosine-5-)-methyltransferase [Mycobacteriales bacterium]|nr:DNA (cytosine-5-)-methyltransferase [Mycobacteriales bacterium]